MLRSLFLVIFLISGLQTFSQKNINDYKYIIVPKGYEFLTKEDAYQLNSLTKFLFNKYGFTAFIRGKEIPDDLAENSCKGLVVDLKKKSTLFVSKVVIELSDCRGDIVFTSSVGSSREKDFKTAYHEALRNAFKDVQQLNYKYNGKADETSQKTEVAAKPQKQEKKNIEKKEDVLKATVVEKEKCKKDAPVLPKSNLYYTFNASKYVFKKQEYGYELLKKQSEDLISLGQVYKLKRENDYLITAGDLSGSGHFDDYGNFILERVNPVTKKIILDTFARD